MTLRAPVRSVCLFALLLMLAANAGWAQGIPPYPEAITNREFYGKTPMTPPSANSPFTDPDLGGFMVRVTDENTNPGDPGSFYHNPYEDVNEWSMDESKFYVSGANDSVMVFAFDPKTLTVSALPGAGSGGALQVPLRLEPTFSFTDPDLMYGTDLKAPLKIATYRFSTSVVEDIFDTSTCATQPAMVPGPKVSSVDNTISDDDNRIVISAGGPSASAEPFVIVYDQNLGCRWYNTETGQIGGAWGAVGQTTTADRFPVNHAKISGDGQSVRIGRGNAGFYVWEVATLTVTSCLDKGGPQCSGYAAVGLDTYINAPGYLDELNTYRRPLNDLTDITQLINPLPLPHYRGMEKTFAWNAGRLNSALPVCGATYSPKGDEQVQQPYDGEIFCIETDGLGSTVWRFAHNRSTWNPKFYWSQPYGNMSLDGRFFAFTSGWDNQVGTFWGNDPRTDVWIVELQ